MRSLISIALLAFSLASFAQDNVVSRHMTEAGDTLVLLDAPCTSMAGIFADYPVANRSPELKAAEIVWKGKSLAACWMRKDGVTLLLDETGDAGALEGSPFDAKTHKKKDVEI